MANWTSDSRCAHVILLAYEVHSLCRWFSHVSGNRTNPLSAPSSCTPTTGRWAPHTFQGTNIIFELKVWSKIQQSQESSYLKEPWVLTVICKVEFLIKLLDSSSCCDGISKSSSCLSNLNPACAHEFLRSTNYTHKLLHFIFLIFVIICLA